MNHLKKERKTRKFLGNTINPTSIEKAELKAYLKGKSNFTHGGFNFSVRQQLS